MDLKFKINELNGHFKASSPQVILKNCIENLYKKKIVYVCSFGSESAVILHMISEIDKNLPIILINTHFLFNETLKYKDLLLDRLKLKKIIEIFPNKKDIDIYDKSNDLWKENPDKCCEIRKVLPLEKKISKFDAWISGRKSYHKGDRTDLDVFDLNKKKIIVNPLAKISQKEIDNYFLKFKLPRHPLFEKGYLSIGCVNCTAKPLNKDDLRSGRWVNQTKTECGIHIKKKD